MPFVYLQLIVRSECGGAVQRQTERAGDRESGGVQGETSQDRCIQVKDLESLQQVFTPDALGAEIWHNQFTF